VPETAPFGDQLRDFLSDPEVAALLAAAPEMGQMLGPVCRMLGVPEPVLPPPSTPTALSSPAVRDPDAWSLITEHWFRCGPTSGSRRRSAARRPALRQPSSVPRFKPA
jgi:hypothetical protein